MITFCVFFKNVNSLRSQNYSDWPESGAITTNVTLCLNGKFQTQNSFVGFVGPDDSIYTSHAHLHLEKIDCNQVNTPSLTLSRYESSSTEPAFGFSILGCCRNMVTPSVDMNVSF